MSFYERNKRAEEERKLVETREDRLYKEYSDVIHKLCPEDFNVIVSRNFSCQFILKDTNWGVLLDEGVYHSVTCEEGLANLLNMMLESCRKGYPDEKPIE